MTPCELCDLPAVYGLCRMCSTGRLSPTTAFLCVGAALRSAQSLAAYLMGWRP